jgi:hypothetical protein
MKRIWFRQQAEYNYVPLKLGLGYLRQEQVDEMDRGYELCPKIYTTRTHRLSGEYYVVEGSGYKAVAVEPRIEFCVRETWQLSIHQCWQVIGELGFRGDGIHHGYTFSELDLGIEGATFYDLKRELLKLNPKATIDTPFYVSRLEPLPLCPKS